MKYYKNRSKKAEEIYHEGMKNGIWKYWHKNGKIKTKEQYKHRYCWFFDYIQHEYPADTWTYLKEDGSYLKKKCTKTDK